MQNNKFLFNSEKFNQLEKSQNNKSIFDYYTDEAMHDNKQRCHNYNPKFISHNVLYKEKKDILLENDLKGINRINSRCIDEKYIPLDSNLVMRLDSKPLYNLKKC
jgi:hypothetical protein